MGVDYSHSEEFSANGTAVIVIRELKPETEYSFNAKTMGAMALSYAVNGTVVTDSTPTDPGKKNAIVFTFHKTL